MAVLPGATSHRGYDDFQGMEQLWDVFVEADRALEAADVPYVVIGGMASAALGRPRASGDIDLLVRPQDARRALQELGAAGFDTDETNPAWIFKATKHGVLLDLLFRLKGDVYLDAEMLERAPRRRLGGHPVPIMPPEDLLVVKALAHDEESSRHWFDALALIARVPLDWDYVLQRAAVGPRRVLALLLYATSLDLVVPPGPIRRLYERVYGEAPV